MRKSKSLVFTVIFMLEQLGLLLCNSEYAQRIMSKR